jgi:CheY-like chemotaxis protein
MTTKKQTKKKTILYVDDEQWLMEGVVDYFSKDYNVVIAYNADLALKIISENKQEIDLLILDVMMPQGELVKDPERGRTSGLELARILIQEKKTKIPIICYTVITDRKIIDELIKTGVKVVVSKKKLPVELDAIIKKHV